MKWLALNHGLQLFLLSCTVANFKAGQKTLYENDYHDEQFIVNDETQNIGRGFDYGTNQFRTPASGIYNFFLVAGVVPKMMSLSPGWNKQSVTLVERFYITSPRHWSNKPLSSL